MSLTTTVLRTKLEATTITITRLASFPFPPGHSHDSLATVHNTPHATHHTTPPATPQIIMTKPLPAPTLTLTSWVTNYITVTPSLPPPEIVTTTLFSTVTYCDAPHTTIVH